MDARLVPAFRTVADLGAENALTCMRSCTRYPTCSVCGYRATDRQCILGDEEESQQPNVSPSPTWIYYQVTGSHALCSALNNVRM
ncbi:hypothetical protein DPMN_149176 [Dreissena polymorpha]|uniref:Apple domain-containing protein n=1 Tax=Dreissena polymorpha TaxID=45954 RepID=A0A9D4J0X0_DREPO|nr:hypothetical protein DPMN_149176 [Dreissena polymorpha]